MAYDASTLLRWLQRKRYQYEVTFSLYMLTPTEKFIFSSCSPSHLNQRKAIEKSLANRTEIDSFLFLFISMIIIAASLYLPEHVATMWNRAWFYYAGDETQVAAKQGTLGMSGGGGADMVDRLAGR